MSRYEQRIVLAMHDHVSDCLKFVTFKAEIHLFKAINRSKN